MKGYKAFKKGLICDPTGKNPFQYAENTVFETDTAEPCNSGFHFCKNPLDTLDYYPLIDDNGNMTITRNGVTTTVDLGGIELDRLNCPVCAIACQAAGFNTAEEAFTAAFGADFNPWA